MQNGYFHETGRYAPEVAVGTGAVEPLVDEYEAAAAVPTVDEHTLDETDQRSQNGPETDRTVAYSGDPVADDANDTDKSTGEDQETRDADNDETLSGANVVREADAEVNAPAEEVRPEEPQAKKTARRKTTA